MIEFIDVSKIYNIGGNIVRALDHANMRIDDGEFVSIIGPSGSGKSTLMNIIGCLDLADEGRYLLDCHAIRDYPESELARIRNRKIGFIFQDFNLLPKLSAYENVELPLIYQRAPRSARKAQVEEALNRVGLWERRDQLATKPSLFLADEPTGNLDQKTGHELIDLFHQLHAVGHTIVLITHDGHVAKEAARSIKILDGHVSDIHDSSEIEEVV